MHLASDSIVNQLQSSSSLFYERLVSIRGHQRQFGQLIAELLNCVMGDGFVLGWELGNYDDPLCITIVHAPVQDALDPVSDTGIYLSDVVEAVLNEFGIRPVPMYFDDDALLSEQEAERIASRLRDYLLGSRG